MLPMKILTIYLRSVKHFNFTDLRVLLSYRAEGEVTHIAPEVGNVGFTDREYVYVYSLIFTSLPAR